MNFDISHLLNSWEFQPGKVDVRRFVGQDGVEKIQLRVDLGILQMNAEGRPDGKRPYGYPSLLEYYLERLEKYRAEHEGDDENFQLDMESCSRLQIEALQYHHRYICLLQMEDFKAVIRDTKRNLQTFDLVEQYAESDELAWSLQQFRPQLLMMLCRAQAAQSMNGKRVAKAIEYVEKGIEDIRQFFTDCNHADLAESSGEIMSLTHYLEELRSRKPLSARERLERDLADALRTENYEKAAQVRDALRRLEKGPA